MILEGYIEFTNEIPVEQNVLGKKYPIEIAGIKGSIITPTLSKDFTDNQKLGSLQPPEIGNLNYTMEFDWGRVCHFPSGISLIKACKIVFDVQVEHCEENGNKIALELELWRNKLAETISFILKKDIRSPKRYKTIASFGLDKFALFYSNSNKRFIPLDKNTINGDIILNKSPYLNENQFLHILKYTSEKNEPQLPFILFLDAERAYFNEDYRKSILDAATAVEVCFSIIIKSNTPNNELGEHIRSKCNSLLLKRELLKVLKVNLPIADIEYKNKMDIKRNKIIHGGYIPTDSEASETLSIAEKTIYELLPLSIMQVHTTKQ